ncbi:SDR family oxidoreductase [Globicatella sanguinis]
MSVNIQVKKVGVPEDIAELILFLASNKASFINGQTITVDGGMSKLMIYHNDQGWSYYSED